MKKKILIGLLIAVALISIPVTASNVTGADSITPKPGEGWTLHVDAKGHFPSNPDLVAHHYCKTGAGGLVAQCQLYDSDSPNASLVGVEVVVDPETYNSFNETEKALWHYHRDELSRVEATFPDLPPEEAASVLKSIEDTYGKIYILWDPGISNLPVGEPEISIAYPGPAQTPAVTPIITPASPIIIPEFPTLALPIAAVMVLILLLARRKKD